MFRKYFIVVCLLCSSTSAFASLFTISPSPYADTELETIQAHLFANIATETNKLTKNAEGSVIQSLPGAVIASPSHPDVRFSQDYVFHWVRDAAITMKHITNLYDASSPEDKARLKPYLLNYISFESQAQMAHSNGKIKTPGQPKFNIDGKIWEGRWARPQNDGPALRAITLMKMYEVFKKENDINLQNKLLPMIQLDLDYIVSEWNSASYDLWEEIKDKEHFFTQIVQRKALLLGNELFQATDPERANRYANAAEYLLESLKHHWREANGYYSETISQQDHKGGGLNSAILLGALYGRIEKPNDHFALDDSRVMSSVYFLRSAFSDLYQVNIRNGQHAPLIGRYPNDIYDGNLFLYGNPWILTTNTLAEYYYSLANLYMETRRIKIDRRNQFFFKQIIPEFDDDEGEITPSSTVFYQIISALIGNGDALMREAKKYSTCYEGSCLHFAEQVDRASGKMLSAKDLSWGYSSLLSAVNARTRAVKKTYDFN